MCIAFPRAKEESKMKSSYFRLSLLFVLCLSIYWPVVASAQSFRAQDPGISSPSSDPLLPRAVQQQPIRSRQEKEVSASMKEAVMQMASQNPPRVCVTLEDGTQFVGVVTEIQEDNFEIMLDKGALKTKVDYQHVRELLWIGNGNPPSTKPGPVVLRGIGRGLNVILLFPARLFHVLFVWDGC